MSERITCHNCEYCKIWYDKDTYTFRLSCTKTSKHGKTITWKSYPTFSNQNGSMVQTEDTIESLTKEFEDYAKRRLAPYWCDYRKFHIQLPQKEDTEQKLYWVSAIIQNKGDKKPWLCTMSSGVLSLDKAMELIIFTRENHTVLSAWVDVFDKDKVKQTVFHECYINIFGDLTKKDI